MSSPESRLDDEARRRHGRLQAAHWDAVARRSDARPGLGGHYHRRLASIHKHLVMPGLRVLELGCGCGDLLAALRPAYAVGVDISPEMVARATARHPGFRFVCGDAAEVDLEGPFDVVILSDLVNDLWDVQRVLERVHQVCAPRGRVILNFYSRLWEMPLSTAARLGLARPKLRQNWLTVPDVRNLLYVAGFEAIRSWQEVLWPLPVPGVDVAFNRFAVKTWPICHLGLANMVLARPAGRAPVSPSRPRVSVIVPARNEQGNISAILESVPEMGGGTELVFVEGHSRDDTWGEIQRQVARRPDRRCVMLRQSGEGKGDAVRAGFAAASGDILMILDADLTVAPADLPRFCDALVSGKGDFINGVRLVYPMEKEAMRFCNLVGNKFFSGAFSWLLGQPVKDTLCGTKVLWKADYERIAANRGVFGDFDPFGDFDLLFGAARQGLKIVDMPVRYRERTYGTTNIRRWKHGWLLLRMVCFAGRRLKFV